MISSQPSVSLETLLGLVYHWQESIKVLEQLEKGRTSEKCPPSTSVLATYIMTDLYNEFSSDDANINRITTNLEATANDLLMLAERIRKQKH
jgi:hypothetical protein